MVCGLEEEFTPTERAAIVAARLVTGEMLSTSEIAETCGLTQSGAWRLADRLSRALPIYLAGGKWQLVKADAGAS